MTQVAAPIGGKTLAELDHPNPNPGLVPGDGTPKPADLAAQATKQAEEAAAETARIEGLKTKDPAQLTDQEKADLVKAGHTIEESAVNAEESTEEENPNEFWDTVDKLRGDKIEINWAEHLDNEGNQIDPTSPEGVLIREKVVAQDAIQKFEAHLKDADPRGYAYILHRQAGGTDEDFFGRKTVTLPEYEQFKNSVDLQQKVYKESLLIKGVSEKQAQKIVDEAVKDKEIFELADKEYKERQTKEEKDLQRIEKQLADEEAAFANSVRVIDKMLTDEISTNSTMKFIVPETKKAEFTQYVRNHLQSADGKFYVVQELENKTLPRILEAMYLQFAGGNIKDLVVRQAQTQNAQRLRLQVNKAKKTPADTSTIDNNRKKTLGEL